MRTIQSLLVALYLRSSSIECYAKKVVLHEVKEKSLLYRRSFNPLAGDRTGSGNTKINRIRFNTSDPSDSSGGLDGEDDIFESENETTNTTTPTNSSIQALTVGFTNDTNKSSLREVHFSPFLSTTLRVTLSPIPTSTLSTFNDDKQSIFGEAYTTFVEHVLEAQEVYDVKVLTVSIFDEELLSLDEANRDGLRRAMLTNELQFSFHNQNENTDDYDDEYDDGVSTDDDDDGVTEAGTVSGQSTQVTIEQDDQLVYSSLRFGIVISAEHTSEPTEATYLSNEQFQKIILHISNKFHAHLLEYVKGSDLYFRYVGSVEVKTYALDGNAGTFESSAVSVPQGLFKRLKNDINNVEEETLNTWSIVVIVVAGLAFIGLIFATVKFYKREKTLQRNRWRSQEIAHSNANASTVKSLRVLYNKQPIQDDYSFDPVDADICHNGYTLTQGPHLSAKQQIQRLYKGYTDVSLQNNSNTEEEIFFSRWPKVAPEEIPPLFPGAPPALAASSAKPHSFGEDHRTPVNALYDLPRQHVYAPPGKVGVAIDIQDGQPVVHKVKKGSPLEGLLHPQDIVVAIDDVDTNCMSAADVTHLMVKRMNYRRKITFVRRG